MTDPTTTAPARRGRRLDAETAGWVQALEASGYSHRSALDYAATIRRAEQLLAARNLTLRSAGPADIAALGEHWPLTRSSRTRLRSALGAASVILERPGLGFEAVLSPPGVARRPSRRRQATGALSAARRAWWDARLEAAGCPRSDQPGRPAVVLERAERILAELGTDLRDADASALAGLVQRWPGSYSSRARLRRSLRLAAGILDRPDLAEAVPGDPERPWDRDRRAGPLSRARSERFEIAAWRLGGSGGLLGLLALHTDLAVGELTGLRWEQFSGCGPGQPGLLRTHAGEHRLAERVAAALAAKDRSVGYLFPAGSGHISAPEATRRLRSVAAYAGLGAEVSPAVLRASRPGRVDPELVETLGELCAAPVGDLNGSVSVEQLLATGVAERTAGQYARLAERAGRILAERGSDLMTCNGVDLAAVAQHFPASRSTRAALRAALARAWDALGRDDPPDLRAVRLPPQPRRRSKALDVDVAQAVEQAAWAQRDQPMGLAVLTGLYAGLRRAEIASLRWEHIELDSVTPEMWVRGKGGLEAAVPIHPILAEALAGHRRPTGWVFPGRTGPDGHINPTTIWLWTKQVTAAAGIDPAKVRTHLLRHTMLTEANDRSGDLRTTQEIARHSRPETTAGYTRVERTKMHTVVAQVSYGRALPGRCAPDPADAIPGFNYRDVVEAIEAEDAPAWIDLGVTLTAAGWHPQLVHDGLGPSLWWSHPGNDQLIATASIDHRDATRSYSLDRLDGDQSDHWDFTDPAALAAAATALAAGVEVAGSARYGPWIEQPFVEFLRGERPDGPRRPDRTPSWLHLVAD